MSHAWVFHTHTHTLVSDPNANFHLIMTGNVDLAPTTPFPADAPSTSDVSCQLDAM